MDKGNSEKQNENFVLLRKRKSTFQIDCSYFETFFDLVFAVPFVAAFHPASKLNMKRDHDFTDEGSEKCSSFEKVFDIAHTFATFMFNFILANWEGEEEHFSKEGFGRFKVYNKLLCSYFIKICYLFFFKKFTTNTKCCRS